MTRTARFISSSTAMCSIALASAVLGACNAERAARRSAPEAPAIGASDTTRTTTTASGPASAAATNAAVPINAPSTVAAAPAEPATALAAAGEAAPSAARRSGGARGAEGGAIGHGSAGGGGATAELPTTRGPSDGRERARDEEADAIRQRTVTNLLTAAAVGDNDRRGNYLEFLSRHPEERNDLSLDMSRRVRFRVVDSRNRNVADAQVELFANGDERVGRGRSHVDGGWDWFPSLRRSGGGVEGPVSVRVHAADFDATAEFVLPATGDVRDTVTVHLPGEVDSHVRVLDLGFLIDVTGSMGDELRYVNREVGHIVERIEAAVPQTRVRVGAVFYRDRTDETNVERIQFTSDTQSFTNDMQRIVAMGGGDYPEDMNAGLDAAMNQLGWSDGNADRVLVVIADAPPQHYNDEQFTWHEAIDTASQRGIRFVPVAASGADRSVEYLFRAMGAATSTPYVYLTDDSGVGAPHLAADTDHVTVERFADLLTRLVISDLQGAGMHEPGAQG